MNSNYNGWTNYATWNVNLWLTNEEGSYSYMMEQARTAASAQYPVSTLADVIRDYVEDNAPELPASIYSDLLQWAIQQANYEEIAAAFLNGVKK